MSNRTRQSPAARKQPPKPNEHVLSQSEKHAMRGLQQKRAAIDAQFNATTREIDEVGVEIMERLGIPAPDRQAWAFDLDRGVLRPLTAMEKARADAQRAAQAPATPPAQG